MQNRILKLFLLVTSWTVVLCILLIASHRFGHRPINSQQLLRSFSELTPDVHNNRSTSSSSDRANRKLMVLSSGSSKSEKIPRLPNCLIIGFSKCGTLALRGFLSLHPDIVSTLREIRYFTMFYKKGAEWYRSQMPPSKEGQVTIEKTPSYILSPEALERIHEYNSSVKLIIIVRDPITRLQSIYSHTFSDDPKSSKNPTFKEWCEGNPRSQRVLRVVNYAQHVEEVFKLFPKENVLVLSEEVLEENPMRVMLEVQEFLGLKSSFSEEDFVYSQEKGFYCFNTSSPHYPKILNSVVLNQKSGCLGSGKGREHPNIDDRFLKELVEVIRPFNTRLFRLIGKKFSWENFR